MILYKTLVALPEHVPPNDSLVASSIGKVSTEGSVHLPVGGRSRCDRLMCLQCVAFWSSVWSGSLVHEQVPHHPSCSPCVTQRTFPMWRLVGTQSSIARTSWWICTPTPPLSPGWVVSVTKVFSVSSSSFHCNCYPLMHSCTWTWSVHGAGRSSRCCMRTHLVWCDSAVCSQCSTRRTSQWHCGSWPPTRTTGRSFVTWDMLVSATSYWTAR